MKSVKKYIESGSGAAPMAQYQNRAEMAWRHNAHGSSGGEKTPKSRRRIARSWQHQRRASHAAHVGACGTSAAAARAHLIARRIMA